MHQEKDFHSDSREEKKIEEEKEKDKNNGNFSGLLLKFFHFFFLLLYSLAFSKSQRMNVVRIANRRKKTTTQKSMKETNKFKTIRNVLRAIYDANASRCSQSVD